MTTAIPRVILVINGHIVYEFGAGEQVTEWPSFETPRERAAAAQSARARWVDIVDLMLAGSRETGSGRVVPAPPREPGIA